MTTVDRVKSICKERRIPISKLEKDLGFANGYVGQLKKGVFPDDRLNQISSYLGISANSLSGIKDDSDIQLLVYIKNNTPEIFSHTLEYVSNIYLQVKPLDDYFRKEIYHDYLSTLRKTNKRKKK